MPHLALDPTGRGWHRTPSVGAPGSGGDIPTMWEKPSEQLVMLLRESDDKWIATLSIIMLTARQSERNIIESL